MGVVRCDGVLVVQFQRADESSAQFRQEVQRSAQERHMSPDRFSAGKPADGLVYYRLENRSGKVFLGRAVVDQRLDVRLCEYTAASCDGVERLVILRVFVQAGCVCLEQGRHLVDEGTCSSGTDAVHPLLDIAAFKIDDLCVLTAQLDGNVGLGRIVLQRSGYCDHFLDKRHTQVFCKGQTAASGDDRRDLDRSQLVDGTSQKVGKRLLNVGKVPFVVREEDLVLAVQHGDLDCGGTDIDSQSM